MEPVRKHDWANVKVPLVGCRAVNNDRARETIQVLRGVVCVPPGGSVKLSANAVCERGTRSDGALADSGHTIVPWSSSLQEAVPVDSSAFVLKSVVHFNLDPIAPVGFNERAGELVVDDKLARILAYCFDNQVIPRSYHGSQDTVW